MRLVPAESEVAETKIYTNLKRYFQKKKRGIPTYEWMPRFLLEFYLSLFFINPIQIIVYSLVTVYFLSLFASVSVMNKYLDLTMWCKHSLP